MANENLVKLKHLEQLALRCSESCNAKVLELTEAITDTIETLDNEKQDLLTFDSTPTDGSTNPVTSDGVKKYVDAFSSANSGATGATATLTTNWTEQINGDLVFYSQTVSVDGVTADNQVVVDCNLTGTDMEADVEVMTAWGCVNRCSQAEGSLTFYCYGDTPTVAIPLNVVVM